MKSIQVPILRSLEEKDLDTALETEGARFIVSEVNWPGSFPYAPLCGGRIARTEDSLIVDFHVSGLDLRVENLSDNGRQWEDSCCELFLRLPDDPAYFNFEINAAGKILAARGTGRGDRVQLPIEDVARIVRVASVEGAQDHEGGIWDWRVLVMIPFDLLGLDPDALPEKLLGNIYKCGDKTPHPHYLSWAPVGTPSPDFHRPEYFGEFLF